MNINELKIGNIVINCDNMLSEVISIHKGGSIRTRELFSRDDSSNVQNVSHIRPVKLNENWITNFKLSDKDYKKGYVGIDVKTGYMTTEFVLTKPKVMGEFQVEYAWEFKTGSLPMFKQLEYVHELQNLFYEITNKDLEYIEQI